MNGRAKDYTTQYWETAITCDQIIQGPHDHTVLQLSLTTTLYNVLMIILSYSYYLRLHYTMSLMITLLVNWLTTAPNKILKHTVRQLPLTATAPRIYQISGSRNSRNVLQQKSASGNFSIDSSMDFERASDSHLAVGTPW